jgi:hypothetical protein
VFPVAIRLILITFIGSANLETFTPFNVNPDSVSVVDGKICGFVNTSTFFIEFEPAGTGYRVMSSPTLDFGNAVEVTPTLEPTSASDNRFEFAASGSRNFYRLEPVQ